MILNKYGDMARWHMSLRQTTNIKNDLARLTNEMSSGVKTDLPAHLGMDQTRLAAIDNQLGRLESYTQLGRDSEAILAAQQTALGRMNSVRQSIAEHLISVGPAPSATNIELTITTSQDAFADMVGALNTRSADRAVFSGAATDRAPLPDAKVILDDMRAVIDFTQPVADIVTDIQTYFTDPAGGYATTHYAGTTSDGMTREVAPNQTIKIDTTAANPDLRKSLAAVAIMAVADEIPDRGKQIDLKTAAEALVFDSAPIAKVEAHVGLTEGKISNARTEMAAQITALNIERNNRTVADPFETASRLQQVQLQLETHYTITGRMSRLSLVNFV